MTPTYPAGERAIGGQPAPVSALRLTGFGGVIHPGEQGDTIRQLLHRSRGRRGGGGGERFLDDTILHATGGGGVYVSFISFMDFRNNENRNCNF